MFDHDARSCYQLLLYSLCVALGQQSQIAQNCVVEEAVWIVLLCISQSVFASKVRDERSGSKFCRTLFDHDVRSCFQLLLFLCAALGQQSQIAWNSVVEEVVWTVLLCISHICFCSESARNSVVEEVVWTVLLCISQSAFAVKARDERSSGKLLVQ